jgi:hypothetical protein
VSAEYTFRVTGRLTPRVLGVLDPLEASNAASDTLLVGQVADRAALHGYIARIEALGLELVELQRLPPRGSANASCPRCNRDGDAGERDARTTDARPWK